MELNDLKKELAVRVSENLIGQKLSIQTIIDELVNLECITEKRARTALARCYFVQKYNAADRGKIGLVQQAAAKYGVCERTVYNAVTSFED